jgi:lipopolysaccharide export system protein LptC
MLARSSQKTVAEAPESQAPGAQPSERLDVFRRAARHSQRVRVLKFVLPTLGALMAIAFVAYSYLMKPISVEISAQASAITDGKLVMSAPKLQGYTSDDRAYSVSADRAIQDVAQEAIVVLEGIAAELPYDARNSAAIDAAHGVFDRTRNALDIDSEINIRTSNGVVARLQSALVDIAGGRMSTGDPVEIRYKGASIASDAMSVEGNGKVVIFEKRVRVTIEPHATETESQ